MKEIRASYKRVANLLKTVVNQHCEDGFKWYPEVGAYETVSVFDLNFAIKKLEELEDEVMYLKDGDPE